MKEPTFPKLLRELAGRLGSATALQEKRYGIWRPISWDEYHVRVREFAQGLASLGMQRGEPVAVLGDNRPEWLIAELAAQALGGMSVGLYPDGLLEEIAHILHHARVRVVVAEDQEQVDKISELIEAGRAPTVERVIYYDPHGLERYDHPYLIDFAQVEEKGRAFAAEHPGWIDEQIDQGSSDDTAILSTTSGTTAKPKLAMLSHHNLLSMGTNLMKVDPMEPGDRYVSFLPLAWIGEQMLALACGMQVGFTISFPEDAATVQADMREIGPHVMFSPPRIWQSLLSGVQVKLDDSGWLKRRIFAWGYRIGNRVAEHRLRGGAPSAWLRLLHFIANLVSLRPVREQLGLTRLKRAYTGGAPLGPDVFRFFHAIGVNLKQIYGQTEVCGIAVVHRDENIKFNTVGTPIPGTAMEVDDAGEILLRSDAVMKGYYLNEDATNEVMKDGWLHTGDAGYIDDDGHLVVIDRAKDVMEARDGTRFSPAFIENKLKFSQYIEEAVAFGGTDRPYVAAMISIDADNVGSWAEREHIGYTTYTDLAQKPEVYDLIAEHVARANEDLPEGVRVRRFVLLHKQLHADDEELTRTRKVRRRTINDRYGKIIEALYSDVDSVEVKVTITYQDGSSVVRDVSLHIKSMDRFEPSQDRQHDLILAGT